MKSNIKTNIAYNFIYQILILILPFVTAPYLSRTVGASGVGVYSFSQSIAMYFTYITVLGLSNYGNRAIASVQDDINARSKVFFEIYSMQLIMFTISIIIYCIYIPIFSLDWFASLIMILWVISSALDVNWFFFGMEQFKLTVLRNTIVKICTVSCIFLFVHSSKDTYIYISIMSISTLISQCCLWPYLRKFIYYVKPSWKGIKQHFKPNFKLFIPVIAASVYNIMDKIMLGYMTTVDEVGYYENAEKIIKMIQSLIVAIGTVMMPRMTSLFSSGDNTTGKKYFDITIEAVNIYVFAAIFGILAAGESFTLLYFGEGFSRTGLLLKVLVVTVFFFAIGNVLRTQYLIPKKQDSIFITSSILGAGLNIVINSILIPKYGALGASIATIFAEVSVCMYQFYSVRNEINILKYIPVTFTYLCCGFIMFVIVKFIPRGDNIWFYFGEQVLLGGIVYITLIGLVLFIKIKLRKSY